MANFKQRVIADELASRLAVTLQATTSVTTVTDPVAVIGTVTAGGYGACIRIQDQRGGTTGGWLNIAARDQTVFTTGVAQILVESSGDASAAPAFASGTITTTGATVVNVQVVQTVFEAVANAATPTATQFRIGAAGPGQDAECAANLAAAINAHPDVSPLVKATVAENVITVTAKAPGIYGNNIEIASSAPEVVVSGATLSGGTGAGGLLINPLTLITCIAECGMRGLKVELWATDVGTAPVFANIAGAALQCTFNPSPYWPVSGLV